MARERNTLDQTLVYLEILKRIPRRSSASTQDIRNSLACAGIDLPLLTLQRYLKVLADSDVVPVRCDKSSRPYGYRMDADASPYLFSKLSPQESLLLKLAKEHLRHLLPAHVTRAFAPLFESADEALGQPSSGRKERSWLHKVAVVANSLPQIPPTFNIRLFEVVTTALYEDKQLVVTYQNSRKEVKTRTLSPLGLVQQDRRLYLVCQYDGYDTIRHLAMHRIKDARRIETNAVRPKGFALNTYIAERHFNYSGDALRPIRLVMEFTQEKLADYVTESPFTREQRLTRLPDRSFRLEATIEDSLMLDAWIHTWRELGGIVRVEKRPV
ncbi:MAG: WYL domain-containing protein [Duodenibacillus sp.]|nr:WYL domain-containing protein [Duodenibacillus sp.]